MNSFSSSTRNQHPHYGLDPGKKEGKRRKKRRKAATSTSSCSQLIHEDPAPSLRSGPVQGEGEAQEEEEEAHPRGTGTLTGLDPGKKEGKRGKKR